MPSLCQNFVVIRSDHVHPNIYSRGTYLVADFDMNKRLQAYRNWAWEQLERLITSNLTYLVTRHFLCHLFHWCCSVTGWYQSTCTQQFVLTLSQLRLYQNNQAPKQPVFLLVPNSQAYLVLPINQIKRMTKAIAIEQLIRSNYYCSSKLE